MTAIRATFSDVRLIKGRKQAQLVFEVPIEQADAAIAALGGLPRSDMERWCGICLLNSGHDLKPSDDPADGNKPCTPEGSKASGEGHDKPRRHFHELSRTQQAALLCKDARFQKWVSEQMGIWPTEENAADFVRNECAVTSRADLGDNEGGYRFDRLYAQYLADTGLVAEPR